MSFLTLRVHKTKKNLQIFLKKSSGSRLCCGKCKIKIKRGAFRVRFSAILRWNTSNLTINLYNYAPTSMCCVFMWWEYLTIITNPSVNMNLQDELSSIAKANVLDTPICSMLKIDYILRGKRNAKITSLIFL